MLLLGGVEACGDPRDIQGCASKNPHGTKGCRTMSAELVWKRQTGLPQKSIWKQPKLVWEHRGRRPEVSMGVRIGPNAFEVWERRSQGSDRYVPAKTLTEQGAAAHMSKLLDVVQTLTPEGPGICWHMSNGQYSRIKHEEKECREM